MVTRRDWCVLCDDVNPWDLPLDLNPRGQWITCNAKSPCCRSWCDRPDGHTGRHAATGPLLGSRFVYAVWEAQWA